MRRPLLLALVAMLAGLLTGCPEQKDFDLDPRPHRDYIQALENLLYAPSPPKVETTEAVVKTATQLAGSLDAGRPPGPSKKAAEAVRGWVATFDVQGQSGYVAMDLSSARKSWQTLRDANFRPEPFFKIATGDLDDLQRSRTGGVDKMQLTLITLVAGELHSVLEKGRLEAETFGEIAGDVTADSPEATAIKLEWDEWVVAWERKLGAVDWPERPPLAAEEVGAIYQQLKNAEQELQGVTGSHESGVTPKVVRTARLDEAGKLIEAAQARITALRE